MSLDPAYEAGFAYWKRNKPYQALHSGLASCARSCGWHGDAMMAWLDGYFDAKMHDCANARHNQVTVSADKFMVTGIKK